MNIILCTTNQDKVNEFKNNILSLNISTYKDENININIEETGTTFQENALLKLNEVIKTFPYLIKKYDLIIAEDSGLCVDALDGQPGIYSARYSGQNASDSANNQKLLSELEGCKERKAHYELCIACFYQQATHLFTGTLDGEIANKEMGTNGFGYDPLFIPKGYRQTLGELDATIKAKISHRSKAIEKMFSYLSSNSL